MDGAVVVHAAQVARCDPVFLFYGKRNAALDDELRRVRAAELQGVVARAHGDTGQRLADIGGVLGFARFADRQPRHRLGASVIIENAGVRENAREVVQALLRETSSSEMEAQNAIEFRSREELEEQ